jgi:uncharacterized MAPEG superfamily protein
MPIGVAGIGAYLRQKQLGSLDQHDPRLQATQATGAAARALAAQSNAWEALAYFTPAVVVAHVAGAAPGGSAVAAVVFVVARILHAIFYIGDRPPLRSLSFLVGLLASLTLFGMAAFA